MKYALIVLSLMLSACVKGEGNSSSSGQPSAPQDPGSPAGPSGPSGPTWPLADATITVTLGSWSCSALAGGGAKCFDGTTIRSVPGLGSMILTKVAVGDAVMCAMAETNGPAQSCADLADAVNCTAPATANYLYCWDSGFSTTAVDQGAPLGFGDTGLYSTGPRDISVDMNGDMCVTESIYNKNSTFIQETVSCGSVVNSLGWIE